MRIVLGALIVSINGMQSQIECSGGLLPQCAAAIGGCDVPPRRDQRVAMRAMGGGILIAALERFQPSITL
ncbi:hypothetical protein [Microbispora sp. NPDC049125]|uniref:hypothetical protein n=1 Tax=Microbispora sp. NPDC049125 TaxID=3154929 RepID=UPI0034679FA0